MSKNTMDEADAKALRMLEEAGPLDDEDGETVEEPRAVSQNTSNEIDDDDDWNTDDDEETPGLPGNETLEAADTPDDVAKGLAESHDSAREALENAKIMRREAHKKYEEAARVNEHNERILQTIARMASTSPEDAVRFLRSFANGEQAPGMVDPELDEELQSQAPAVRNEIISMRREILALKNSQVMDKITNAVLTQVSARQDVAGLPDRVRTQVIEAAKARLLHDKTVYDSNLQAKAKEVIGEEAEVYGGLKQHFIRQYLAAKKASAEKAGKVPKNTGRRAVALNKPKGEKIVNHLVDGWDAYEKQSLRLMQQLERE